LAGNASSGSDPIRIGTYYGPNTSSEIRGYLSFDLSSVGSGRQIKSAVLTLSNITWAGNPFVYGALRLESIDYGTTLDASAAEFNVAAGWTKAVATSASSSFTIDVLSPVAALYSLSPRVQFRLRFLNAFGRFADQLIILPADIKLSVTTRLP